MFGCARLRKKATAVTNSKKATKANLVMPTEGEKEIEDGMRSGGSGGQILAEHSRQLADLQNRLTAIETVQGNVSLYMPKNLEPLGRRELETLLEEHPAQWFEVVADYKRGSMKLNKGKVFCIQNYRDIPGHVSAGLKLVGAAAPR